MTALAKRTLTTKLLRSKPLKSHLRLRWSPAAFLRNFLRENSSLKDRTIIMQPWKQQGLNPDQDDQEGSRSNTTNEESKNENANNLIASLLRRQAESQLHDSLPSNSRNDEHSQQIQMILNQLSGQGITSVSGGMTTNISQQNPLQIPATGMRAAAINTTDLVGSSLQAQLLIELLARTNQQSNTSQLSSVAGAAALRATNVSLARPLPPMPPPAFPSMSIQQQQLLQALSLQQQMLQRQSLQEALRMHQLQQQQQPQQASIVVPPSGREQLPSEYILALLQQQQQQQHGSPLVASLQFPSSTTELPSQSSASRLLSGSASSEVLPATATTQSLASTTSSQLATGTVEASTRRVANLKDDSSSDKEDEKPKPAKRKRGEKKSVPKDDMGTNPDDAPTKRQKRAYHHESFPVKLHRLLRETEEAGRTDIISFSEDGKEFHVHKPVEFEEEILPKYFRHNQLSSFRRLLNMYGFLRLSEGAEGGTFRHPSFLKGKPELCKDLDRVR